jgi:hypothetical protein
MYRLKSTGEIKSQGEIRKMFPNVSLPAVWDAAVLNRLNIDPILESPAPQVTRYQTASKNGVTQNASGNWVWAWVVTDADAETVASIDKQEADSVRKHRNTLLSDSDWTQVADAPVNKAAWATYRQSLRDVTLQAGFPWNVSWPVKPE